MQCYKYIVNIPVLGLLLLEIVVAVHYTNEWAVQIQGGPEIAKSLAEKHGYVYVGQIMQDYYSIRHKKVAKRSIYPSSYYHRTMAQEPNVRWLEQQVAKKRVKRNAYYYKDFNDPKWPRMWYLNRGQEIDMNVMSAWKQGITGKGVVVTILDDGIEKNHPDLQMNYDGDASYDVNNHDSDPQPRYDFSNENRHGTRCAGEVAAQAGNGICSVGVAFNARIGGVRMLDGDVTDSVEAQSLSLNPNHIDIYSASWGPDDDGRTVDGPATLAKKAFYDGISKGRRGLGSIFVWASGNGGRDGDSCNCDGYTNSIHTLSISSATENGNVPWYSEACSSTLATTYSSGSGGEKQIVTTDLRRICTVNHTGTSASAPLAAGICALALQANPSLTWRDMQHIVVQTARKANLKANDWVVNGVNREVSHSFGFGLMDAGAMVKLARNWTTVPKQHVCEIRSQGHNKPIPMNGKIVVPLDTDGCEGTVDHVKYLEHVQARITLSAARRGEIQIFLISPMGTRSTLLARRIRDTSREGFNNWAFMTTHSWGETAKGRWLLEIENGASSFQEARLKDWVLVLYGTEFQQQDMLTTTTTPLPSSTLERVRKENKPSRIWVPHEPTTRYPPYKIFGKNYNSYQKHNKPTYYINKNRKPSRYPYRYPNSNPYYNDPLNLHRIRHEQHVCIFETLAKRNNMSTQQYMRLVRSNLSAAELKEWSLKVMGTETHPQSQNVSQPLRQNTLKFSCPGVVSKGICIECRPGYYKHKDVCVASCPEHYYGYMKTIPIESKQNISSRTPLYHRQGVCYKCSEACKTCKGPNVKDCFQCSDDYEVRDSFCRKKLIMNFLDPDMLSFFVWVIILCTSAILLFGVVFIVLQARDHQILCWKEKRHYDDSKGKYNGVTTMNEERENHDRDKFENINVVRNVHYRAEDMDYRLTRPPLPHRSLRS